MDKIPLGISQCLLGDPVRYDGGHKRNVYLTEVLAEYFHYHPCCPEVAIGLGVPRKPIRMIVTDQQNRVLGIDNPGLDVTQALAEQADITLANLPEICGYVFMQNSPSCGVYGLKRYDQHGNFLDKKGRGAYAAHLIAQMPLLPVEEAGRLSDAVLRDNFITRVFAYYEWRTSVLPSLNAKTLLAFYSRYKYQIMAHHIPSYFALGKLLANFSINTPENIGAEFIQIFMTALSIPATRKSNTNTLMHLRGYLKGHLSKLEQVELSQVIESYRLGHVPLVVPLTLLRHHLIKIDNVYLKQQCYWAPHPERLGLRNFIIG